MSHYFEQSTLDGILSLPDVCNMVLETSYSSGITVSMKVVWLSKGGRTRDQLHQSNSLPSSVSRRDIQVRCVYNACKGDSPPPRIAFSVSCMHSTHDKYKHQQSKSK